MDHFYKTEGVVLKRSNFGEADRILTLYTKHYGKIRVIAKGVRKITSRKAASLEIFNHLLVVLAKGKNLDIISETHTFHSFSSWRKNLLKVGIAYYFCELVDKLTPDSQENQRVFNLLKDSLGEINNASLKILVREFEERLLEELGFGIPFPLKNRGGSLRSYIESITEKKIATPRFIRKIYR